MEVPSKNTSEVEEKDHDEVPKILVVDDDAGIRDTMSTILRQEGYITETAETGKKAIEACQRESYDVALIDIRLPDMDGTVVLDMLKKIDPAMIKIMITGYPSLENAVQSLNAGAEGYIVKPFKTQRLLEQIKEHLERRQKTKWEILLRKTGLSAYETKIYLALTLEGVSEARELSISSGVPRTKTYASLKKLIQRGLVHEIPGETQRFSIVTPSGSFGSFVQSWKKDLSEQATMLVELEKVISTLESISERKQSLKPVNMRKEEVWSIQEGEEITRRTGEALSRAKTSAYIITTETGLVQFYKNFNKVLDDLTEKGVKIKIKVPIGPTNANFINELRYAYKIENMQVTIPIFLLIVDKNEVLFTNLKTEDQKTSPAKEFGLLLQGEDTGAFFSELLNLSEQEDKNK